MAPEAVPSTSLPTPTSRWSRFLRRQGWLVAIAVIFLILLFWRFSQIPEAGLTGEGLDRTRFAVRALTAGTLALILLAMAQAVIVISGGIDLSVGAMLLLTNCVAALLMDGQDLATCLLISVGVLVMSVLLSALIGLAITVSGVPDIVVTLAASFALTGAALAVLGGPGGGTAPGFQELLAGGLSNPVPSIVVIALALGVVWLPFSRSRAGIAIYAVGSDRRAAFLAGVPVARTRITAYALSGLFTGLAGLVTTAVLGQGDPRASTGAQYTLLSVAAVVLGGVLLSGGVGGLVGPVLAALSLALIPQIMLGLKVDPNLAEVARGVIIIVVVAIGGVLQARRGGT
jgi:ribose transport system permease protein